MKSIHILTLGCRNLKDIERVKWPIDILVNGRFASMIWVQNCNPKIFVEFLLNPATQEWLLELLGAEVPTQQPDCGRMLVGSKVKEKHSQMDTHFATGQRGSKPSIKDIRREEKKGKLFEEVRCIDREWSF